MQMLPSTAALPLVRALPLFATASPVRAARRPERRTVLVRSHQNPGPERDTLSWRSAADESLKERHLIEHTKDQMSDYCTALKGESCCSCWDAVEEFSKLEMELPRAELETMVQEAGGDTDRLISSIHHRAHMRKTMAEESSPDHAATTKPFPAPDELPKTQEELEEETEALMPESTHTRLLRRMADHD